MSVEQQVTDVVLHHPVTQAGALGFLILILIIGFIAILIYLFKRQQIRDEEQKQLFQIFLEQNTKLLTDCNGERKDCVERNNMLMEKIIANEHNQINALNNLTKLIESLTEQIKENTDVLQYCRTKNNFIK